MAMAFFVHKLLGVLVLFVISASECQSNSQFGCPKQFNSIGKKCYYFSNDSVNWFQAHYHCQSLNSTLVITTKSESAELRKFLNHHSKHGKYGHWVDGRYNDKKHRWEEGKSGKPLPYLAFNRFISRDATNLVWNCIKFDPNRQNKWGMGGCLEENRFICQTKNKCEDEKTLTNDQKQLCQENESSPGFLVRKPREFSYVCPGNMILIGRKCYWFSKSEENWSEAHFACQNNGTKLAILNSKKNQDLLIRYLNSGLIEKHERWIGAKFDEKHKTWIWARNNQLLRYENFAKEVTNPHQAYHSITLDPTYRNQWNSKNVFEKKHYICQAKSKKVIQYFKHSSRKDLQKKYKKMRTQEMKSFPKIQKTKEEEYSVTCPQNMILVGSLCYSFSNTAATWPDANNFCKLNKSKLATLVSKEQGKLMTSFLNFNTIENHERWIGGKFDERKGEWVWVDSGEPLRYHNFASEVIDRNQKRHYITLDPAYKNSWNSRDAFEKKHFICQVEPTRINNRWQEVTNSSATIIISNRKEG